MNRDQRRDIVEVVGLIAIVGSLIFLGLEIRQNTLAQKHSMQMDRVIQSSGYLSQPLLADIHTKVKALDGPEPLEAAYMERYQLTSAEAVLWSRHVSRGLWIFDAQFTNDGPSEQLSRELKNLMLYPDFRMAFETNEDSLLSQEFIDYVNSIDNLN